MSWRYVSRLYMLVPVVTLLFFIGLDLLITFAWSVPTARPPYSEIRPGADIKGLRARKKDGMVNNTPIRSCHGHS